MISSAERQKTQRDSSLDETFDLGAYSPLPGIRIYLPDSIPKIVRDATPNEERQAIIRLDRLGPKDLTALGVADAVASKLSALVRNTASLSFLHYNGKGYVVLSTDTGRFNPSEVTFSPKVYLLDASPQGSTYPKQSIKTAP